MPITAPSPPPRHFRHLNGGANNVIVPCTIYLASSPLRKCHCVQAYFFLSFGSLNLGVCPETQLAQDVQYCIMQFRFPQTGSERCNRRPVSPIVEKAVISVPSTWESVLERMKPPPGRRAKSIFLFPQAGSDAKTAGTSSPSSSHRSISVPSSREPTLKPTKRTSPLCLTRLFQSPQSGSQR